MLLTPTTITIIIIIITNLIHLLPTKEMATRKNSKTERKSMNGPMEGQSKTNQAMARQAKPSQAKPSQRKKRQGNNVRQSKAEIQDYRVLYSDADGLETKKTVDVPTRETSLIGLNKSTTYTIKNVNLYQCWRWTIKLWNQFDHS